MIKIHYKSDLTDSEILKTKNILSFHIKNKDGLLPIIELKWRFIWSLFKHKIKRNKIFLLITCLSNSPKDEKCIEFFKIKSKNIKSKYLT